MVSSHSVGYVPPAELYANGVFKRTATWWSATGKAAAPQNSVSLARSAKSNSKRIASCAWLCATLSRVGRLAARGRGARTPYSPHLTMRRSMPRFTRLANGFSKKLENHAASVALHSGHGTFCRVHGTLRVTPAMEVLLSDHVEHRRLDRPLKQRGSSVNMRRVLKTSLWAALAAGILLFGFVAWALWYYRPTFERVSLRPSQRSRSIDGNRMTPCGGKPCRRGTEGKQ
jgi:hypothetical protein